MTKEDKNLLLKDLCARLPYGVIIEHEGNLSKLDTIFMCDSISISSTSMDKKLSYNLDLDEIKPYLYPISSMTPKQKAELSMLVVGVRDIFTSFLIEVEFYHEHHIDYVGLIPMGLAIDATGLNIY